MKYRTEYLDYEAVTKQLQAWATSHPRFLKLDTLVKTEQGRDVWKVTLGSDPGRQRPTVWLDANMHAIEVCGTNVAMAWIDLLLQVLSGTEAQAREALKRAGVSENLAPTLRELRYFVIPRISPDGAESILKTGAYCRSFPRDRRLHLTQPYWRQQDLDGDGRVRMIRIADPSGEYVESPRRKHVLVPRELGDTGPFYKIYTEGLIENWDGLRIPAVTYLGDYDTDLNRNFPYSWAPAEKQPGAGAYPMSEPESRAIVEFTSKHPEIFLWINLHTFGGVFIRPPGDQGDEKMNPDDLSIYHEIGDWAEKATGYPMVSGFQDFLYEPGKPLYGDLTDYAYHQRGCVAFVCELWDIFTQTGLPRNFPKKLEKKFSDKYNLWDRADVEALSEWDERENKGRIFAPWKKFTHPQLGEVELGGCDILVGITNPPLEKIAQTVENQLKAYLPMAAMAPRVRFDRPKIQDVGPSTRRVKVGVYNEGYLGTPILASARQLEWNEKLVLQATAEGGLELLDHAGKQGPHREIVEHLSGFGMGRFHSAAGVMVPGSAGSGTRYDRVYTVSGKGVLKLTLTGARFGTIETTVELA